MIIHAKMFGRDIESFIKPYNKKYTFKGVFSADTLPFKHQFTLPAAFIVNFSPATSPGTHWCGIYITKYNRIGYFFDSFGFPVKINSIIKWLKHVCKKVIFNPFQIQHYNSLLCGLYSSVFIIFCLKGKTMKQYIELFSKNLTVNDITIRKYSNYLRKLSM